MESQKIRLFNTNPAVICYDSEGCLMIHNGLKEEVTIGSLQNEKIKDRFSLNIKGEQHPKDIIVTNKDNLKSVIGSTFERVYIHSKKEFTTNHGTKSPGIDFAVLSNDGKHVIVVYGGGRSYFLRRLSVDHPEKQIALEDKPPGSYYCQSTDKVIFNNDNSKAYISKQQILYEWNFEDGSSRTLNNKWKGVNDFIILEDKWIIFIGEEKFISNAEA